MGICTMFEETLKPRRQDVRDTLVRNGVINGVAYSWVYTQFKTGIREAYDSNYRLVARFDRSGIEHRLAYITMTSSTGSQWTRLSTVTHVPSGRQLVFQYSPPLGFYLQSITDPSGNLYTYALYSYDRLTDPGTVTFPSADDGGAQLVRSYTVDSKGCHLGGGNHLMGYSYLSNIDELGINQLNIEFMGGQDEKFCDPMYAVSGFWYTKVTKAGHNAQPMIGTHYYNPGHEEFFTNAELFADTDTAAYRSLDIKRTYISANGPVLQDSQILRPESVSPRCAGCDDDYQNYTYSTTGDLLTRTDYLNRKTVFVNDTRGLPLTETEAADTTDARVTTRTWDTRFPLMTSEIRGAVAKEWRYNNYGHLVKEIVRPASEDLVSDNCPVGSLTCHQTNYMYVYYNIAHANETGASENRVITKTIKKGPRPGVQTIIEYRDNGDLWKITDAKGHVTEVLATNAHGQITQLKDSNGRVTDNVYNNLRQLVSSSVASDKTSYTYYTNGRLKTLTQPDNTVFTYTYTKAGSVKTASRKAGEVGDVIDQLEYQRDSRGHILKIIATRNGTETQTWINSFDTQGRLETSKDGTNKWSVNNTYNDNNLLRETCRSDELDDNDSVSEMCDINDYNNRNELWRTFFAARLTDGTLGNKTRLLTLGFDPAGRINQVTDPLGINTFITNNEVGRHTIEQSSDFGKREADFDLAGNEAFKTDPDGYDATKAFDNLDRLTQADYSDGGNLTQLWDVPALPEGQAGPADNYKGRLSSISRLNAAPEGSAEVSEAYVLNQRGDKTSIVQSIDGRPDKTVGIEVTVGADGTGRPKKLTYPGGLVIDYLYNNSDGRVHQVNAIKGGITYEVAKDITWQPLINRLRSLTFGNNYQYWRDRDAGGRLSRVRVIKADGVSNAFYAPVRYDARNRVNGYGNITFGYDDLDHLKLQGLTDTANPARTELEHDNNGNLTEWRKYDNNNALQAKDTLTYVTSPYLRNRLIQEAISPSPNGGLDGWNDPYTHDLSGYVKTHGRFNFRYDHSRSLNLFGIDGNKTRYVYDGWRRRVLKIQSGNETRYLYDAHDHLIYEQAADGSQRNYVWLGDIPLAVLDQDAAGTITARYYIETDFTNTPRFLRRASDNTTVWEWPVAPYGNAKPTGPVTFNLRYPGQYFDAESGLHYNHTRYFQPRTGRYLQPDLIKLEGGVNVYTYADGNPVHYTDPTGTFVCASFGQSENCTDGQRPPPAGTPTNGPLSPIGIAKTAATAASLAMPGLRGVKPVISAVAVPGRVQSRINLKNEGMEHVVARHLSSKTNASQFSITEGEVRGLLQSKDVVNTPVSRTIDTKGGLLYVREFDAGRAIGFDKFSGGQETSTMTILTNKFGELESAFPGMLK
jgi:RHS repeat-associated protein